MSKEVKIFTLWPSVSTLSSRPVITDLLSLFLSITEIHSNFRTCMYDIRETKKLFWVPWDYEHITCCLKYYKHACQVHFSQPTNLLVYIVSICIPKFNVIVWSVRAFWSCFTPVDSHECNLHSCKWGVWKCYFPLASVVSYVRTVFAHHVGLQNESLLPDRSSCMLLSYIPGFKNYRKFLLFMN